MLQHKKIVIIAGEESGDQHGASFVKELKAKNHNLELSGIGGTHMQAAGVNLVTDLTKFGSTGLTALIKNICKTFKAFQKVKKHILETKPDLLILIDYPEFNLRLAKAIKKNSKIKILYYISPQIWAWRSHRINIIKKVVDHMAVILPFEKELYTKAGIPVTYVGHPLIEKIEAKINDKLENLPKNATLIALLPGSRMNEISKHMPILIKACELINKTIPKAHYLVPVAKTVAKKNIEAYFKNTNLKYTLIDGQAIETANSSDCIIVASGTASLECALLQKPMCIIYKISPLSAFIGKKLMLVKFLGLCNLLSDKLIVPELLQEKLTPEALANITIRLLQDNTFRTTMIKDLQDLTIKLSTQSADLKLSTLVLKLITHE